MLTGLRKPAGARARLGDGSPEPGQDESEVVADGGKDDVGGIALAVLEMAAAEVTVGLHVSDHGLDGAAASQLALDDAEDAALLAGDEDVAWIGRTVTPISLVDIGTLDLAAGKPFGVFDHDAQRVANRTNVARKVIYPGFLAVTFHELESIMIPSGR